MQERDKDIKRDRMRRRNENSRGYSFPSSFFVPLVVERTPGANRQFFIRAEAVSICIVYDRTSDRAPHANLRGVIYE